MRVRIKQCSVPTYWYYHNKGCEYYVQEYSLDSTMYKCVIGCILKTDCEIIEEPKTSDMPKITFPESYDVIDFNGIQTEPFTHEQKKVIAVEKDIKKCEIFALLLEDFKKANELQRIGLVEIFEELGYSNSDMVKLYRTFQNEL